MSSRCVPVIADCLYVAIGAASAAFADMDAKYKNYVLTCTADCFVKQSAGAPTAAVASGNRVVKAGEEVILDTRLGLKVAVIQASAGGHATLSPVGYTLR